MYFIAKLIQATGLTFIAIDFIRNFPELMDMKILGIGVIIFAIGWSIQNFMLKR